MTSQTPEIKPDPVKAAFSTYVAGLLTELFERPDAADVIERWERNEVLFLITPRGLAAVPATESPTESPAADDRPVPGNYL
ncbi:hypothetical protein OG884_17430 [Streptosporangium sp. NBC_01755]|uniref:hypothetical protein n=1 Tax=Streptosporangium sp. NBC_01755 TaxID=2975949 RepID=UPI002DD7F245|nr:hypothetical protein [Streptosporangium sp. NBC_01755]WSD03592.1 hypothetical protein OG884_17430 [Streptosporangium sp. NBC_01755]